MAKKGSRGGSRNKVTEADEQRYGDAREAFVSEFDAYSLAIAADIMSSDVLRRVVTGISALSLLGVVYGLWPGQTNYVLVGVSIVLSISMSVLSQRWHDIMMWRVRKTNLSQILLDGGQRVVVCGDAIHIEHGDTVDDLPFSDLSGVRTDRDATLVLFRGSRAAYIPREPLGDARFQAVTDFLKEKAGK